MENKKAQNLPVGTLLILIMGIAVVVIVLLGFYMGWDFIFGKIGLIPGTDLDAFVSGCSFSASQGPANLQAGYCSVRDKAINIPGRGSVYTNCKAVESYMTDVVVTISCDGNEYEQFCINRCQSTKGKFRVFEIMTEPNTFAKCTPPSEFEGDGSCNNTYSA